MPQIGEYDRERLLQGRIPARGGGSQLEGSVGQWPRGWLASDFTRTATNSHWAFVNPPVSVTLESWFNGC